MVRVVDAENVCPGLILAVIKIILPLCQCGQTGHHSAGVPREFCCVLGGSCFDRLLLDRSIGDTRPRSCRTDVANTAADLSETPVRSQDLASEGREIAIFDNGDPALA